MARTRFGLRGLIRLLLVVGLLAGGGVHAALPRFEQPEWFQLTPEQRAILAPLAKEWGEMDAFRRKKWIGIAQRFPSMSPAEQESIQRNMREWARLAPEERRIAREKYKSLLRIDPEEREAIKQKWQEYSALSEQEKEALRHKVPAAPKVKTPKKPPASAPKPQARVATPRVAAPNSPISPIKPPKNPLRPNATTPLQPVPKPPAEDTGLATTPPDGAAVDSEVSE
ncbi:DUF3106 domain-containing protein [Sulfuricystis multivorans]|uniref:DUF3106 domain-containing protein n=1 Tax=Sulfuricystis multivorans TaxID=2211108 RepID=UPI000F83E8AC|nr:DUF3106 domain-containing protein [Sulfuricystis multivorans]